VVGGAFQGGWTSARGHDVGLIPVGGNTVRTRPAAVGGRDRRCIDVLAVVPVIAVFAILVAYGLG
jgi:hypothetical protein